MSTLILGVGEVGATSSTGGAVKTYALGSCVALILMDPKTHAVGMAHIALPESAVSLGQAQERPGRFADTALPVLLMEMDRAGYRGDGRGLIAKLVGGAQVLDQNGVFNIGKRNVLAIKKALWQKGMGAVAEDVGGTFSRTVTVDVDMGRVLIESPGRESWQI